MGVADPDDTMSVAERNRIAVEFDDENEATQRAILREGEIQELTHSTIVATVCVVPFAIVMTYMMCGDEKSISDSVFFRFWRANTGCGILEVKHVVSFLISTPSVFIAGLPFFLRAWRAWPSMMMDTLVALGVGVSYAASLLLCVMMACTSAERTASASSMTMVGAPSSSKASNTTKTAKSMAGMDMGIPTYFDVAAMTLFFVCLGRLIEARAKRSTGDALVALMQLVPATAARCKQAGGGLETVPTSSIVIGDFVRVSPGMAVPCDGEVDSGQSAVNEAMVTGEAVPVEKQEGDAVIAGTVNVGEGEMTVRVTACGRDTALAHIQRVVRDASASKPSVLRMTDYVMTIFVPVVVVASAGVFVFWAVAGAAGAYPATWRNSNEGWLAWAFSFGLATLVCACPCALGLAAPTCVVVACGIASRLGILLKSAEALERGAAVAGRGGGGGAVVFDKTGTLTTGEFAVTSFELHRQFFDLSDDSTGDAQRDSRDEFKEQVKEYVHVVEAKSNHPIAQAITRATSSSSNITVKDWKQVPGRGASATLVVKRGSCCSAKEQVVRVAVGSLAFLSSGEQQCDNIDGKVCSFVEAMSGTHVCVAVDGRFVATLQLRDTVKKEARATVAYLKHRLKAKIYMVSGDSAAACSAVAADVGIESDCVFSNVLPAQKVDIVKSIQNKKPERTAMHDGIASAICSFIYDTILQRKKKMKNGSALDETVVAFVGDGVNDAAALAQAHIGIAIGGGVDVAIDAADAVLLRDDIFTLCALFDLCALAVDRIVLNIIFSCIYNLAMLPLAAGLLFPVFKQQVIKPQIAGAAMMLSSITVVCSSLLLRLFEAPTPQDAYSVAKNSALVANGKFAQGRSSAWREIDGDDDDDENVNVLQVK